jgi:hypothetical protein
MRNKISVSLLCSVLLGGEFGPTEEGVKVWGTESIRTPQHGKGNRWKRTNSPVAKCVSAKLSLTYGVNARTQRSLRVRVLLELLWEPSDSSWNHAKFDGLPENSVELQ